MRRCKVCGAVLNTGTAHRHEDAEWKPMYDDFEGALEGYETVPGAGLSGKTSDEKTEPEPHESERIAELAAREAEPNPYRSQDQIVRDQERTRILALLDSVEAEEAVVNALMAAVDAGADLGSEARAAITALVGLVERVVPNGNDPHEHTWRPTGYGGGSARYGKPVTSFRHEQCACGATRRVDFPTAADREKPDEPKEKP